MRARSGVIVGLAASLLLAGCQQTASAAPARAQTGAPTSATSGCTVVAGKADRRCTPGAVNPQVTPLNIGSTICRSGWAASVRPPAAVTEPQKRAAMRRYGLTMPLSTVEFDHLIPIEVGGALDDQANLWPQVLAGTSGAKVKDRDENAYNRAVCLGRMKLADAQAAIVAKWTHG